MSFPRRFATTQRFTLGAPRTISVSRDGNRVVFLRSTAGDDPVNRMWTLDIEAGTDTPVAERLVVDPVKLLGDGEAEMTDAERARRERAREAGGGIVTYALNRDATAAFFALGGQLFRADLDAGSVETLPSGGSVYDPRPDPTDQRVAYVSGGELRVTGDDQGDRLIIAEDDPLVSWGSAEFVAAEEMGRSRGYWWAPDGSRLLVARVDTSAVPIWWISNPTQPWDEPRANRYPAAGQNNAVVDLALVDLDGTQQSVDWRRGEFEYLASASWTPHESPMLTVQTRDQRTLVVLSVDPTTGETTEVHRQTDDDWIELMPGTPARSGGRLITTTIDHDTIKLAVDGNAIGPDGLQVRSLVRIADGAALVTCTTEPTELHVARIPLDGSAPEFLTSDAGVHRVTSGGPTDVISSANMDHFGTVSTIVNRERADEVTLVSHSETPDITPNVTFIEAGSRALRTAVLLPHDHDGSPLPVLMDPYGGPHAQRVQQARNLFLTSQWFADQGFAVIIADGRGTPARGAAFERSVAGDLAAPVLDDQVAALAAVAEQFPIDTDRVAIRGWSFGGYLAALAVIRRPDIFHAAVAGAPVTDWRLYDTHYTERYLGHPVADADNYQRCDLCNEAKNLTRPLLLIHGLADDNVVAAHTLALSRSLLEAGRPHEVLPLSGVTHMTPQENVAENLLTLQLAFIRRALGASAPG